jgi:hypothetical protein
VKNVIGAGNNGANKFLIIKRVAFNDELMNEIKNEISSAGIDQKLK